jgi:hypothetical protein
MCMNCDNHELNRIQLIQIRYFSFIGLICKKSQSQITQMAWGSTQTGHCRGFGFVDLEKPLEALADFQAQLRLNW